MLTRFGRVLPFGFVNKKRGGASLFVCRGYWWDLLLKSHSQFSNGYIVSPGLCLITTSSAILLLWKGPRKYLPRDETIEFEGKTAVTSNIMAPQTSAPYWTQSTQAKTHRHTHCTCSHIQTNTHTHTWFLLPFPLFGALPWDGRWALISDCTYV